MLTEDFDWEDAIDRHVKRVVAEGEKYAGVEEAADEVSAGVCYDYARRLCAAALGLEEYADSLMSDDEREEAGVLEGAEELIKEFRPMMISRLMEALG